MINWPSAYAIAKTLETIKVDITKYIGLKIAPLVTTTEQKVKYLEYTRPGGMTKAHALDTPIRATGKGSIVEKEFEPLHFAEKTIWTESDIMKLAKLNMEHQRMTLAEMTALSLGDLKPRVIKRIEWAIWQAILNGSVTVNEDNIKQTAAYGVPAANIALVPTDTGSGFCGYKWSDATNAKCISDIENMKINFFRGTGFEFGEAWMNSKTLQYICNAADTYTKYSGSIAREKWTVETALALLKIYFPDITFVIYDGVWDNEAGTITNFIPDGKVVFWPKSSPGEIIDFVSTPSIYGGTAESPQPGIFTKPFDKTKESPPSFEIAMGIYGAPRIIRPTSYFVMDVD